jgi:hypothetical protein
MHGWSLAAALVYALIGGMVLGANLFVEILECRLKKRKLPRGLEPYVVLKEKEPTVTPKTKA